MRTFDLAFHPESIDPSVYIATGVIVLGNVTIGRASSLWFHAVVRGDTEQIVIGEETNIQDGCILHADPGYPCRIGDRVTIGHAAVVHGATLADDVMIGMRAVVLNGATIGSGSIIGAGAVVPERATIPANSLVFGVPARVVRTTDDSHRALITRAAAHYVEAAQAYRRHVAEHGDYADGVG